MKQTMKKLGSGQTADIMEYGEDRILKWYKPGFPGEAVRQEFEVTGLAYASGLPVPEPYGRTELEGRFGIVLQRLAGRTLLSVMLQEPGELAGHARTLAQLHARLHAVEAPPLLTGQSEVWLGFIERTPLLSAAEKERIIRYLDALPRDRKWCHGDFHPDNVLVGGGSPWILDWMNGTAGHPAADAARTLLLLSLGSAPEGMPETAKAELRLLRERVQAIYIEEYGRITGWAYTEIDRWTLPVAAARLEEGVPAAEKELLLRLIRERLAALN